MTVANRVSRTKDWLKVVVSPETSELSDLAGRAAVNRYGDGGASHRILRGIKEVADCKSLNCRPFHGMGERS